MGAEARRPWNNSQASRVIISQKTLRATGAVASTRLVLALTLVLSLSQNLAMQERRIADMTATGPF